MELYILIIFQNTDKAHGAKAIPFLDKAMAQATMRQDWEKALESLGFDRSVPATNDHSCECSEYSAVVREGENEERWRIERHKLNVQVAVEVSGGLVTKVYANAGVHIDVYDLDVSDFPDEGEQAAADERQKELEHLINGPDWRAVW